LIYGAAAIGGYLGVRLVGVATPSLAFVLGLVQQLGRTQGLFPTFPEAEREETLVGQPSTATAC
jgi:hypothetical protein